MEKQTLFWASFLVLTGLASGASAQDLEETTREPLAIDLRAGMSVEPYLVGLGGELGVSGQADRLRFRAALLGYFNGSGGDEACTSNSDDWLCLDFDFPEGPGLEISASYMVTPWLGVGARARAGLNLNEGESRAGILLQPELRMESQELTVTPVFALRAGVLAMSVRSDEQDLADEEADGLLAPVAAAELGFVWHIYSEEHARAADLGLRASGGIAYLEDEVDLGEFGLQATLRVPFE